MLFGREGESARLRGELKKCMQRSGVASFHLGKYREAKNTFAGAIKLDDQGISFFTINLFVGTMNVCIPFLSTSLHFALRHTVTPTKYLFRCSSKLSVYWFSCVFGCYVDCAVCSLFHYPFTIYPSIEMFWLKLLELFMHIYMYI